MRSGGCCVNTRPQSCPDNFTRPALEEGGAVGAFEDTDRHLEGADLLEVAAVGALAGLTRNYLGVHFCSDTLCGWLLCGMDQAVDRSVPVWPAAQERASAAARMSSTTVAQRQLAQRPQSLPWLPAEA